MDTKKTKVIILLVTYDCNLRCSYCYEPKKAHHKMNASIAKSVISECIASLDDTYNSVIIQFMGGEPLMNFDLIREVTEWIYQQDFNVKIIDIHTPTNGTILNEEIKDWLLHNNDRFKVSLSFDGDRLMHNINRSQSADKVDLKFFAHTYPDVSVKMTLSPQTIGHFYDGFKFLLDEGFERIGPSLAIGKNIGWNKKHLYELSKQLDLIVNLLVDRPQINRTGNLSIPICNILNKDAPDLMCRAGKEIICYDYNGIAYPCHMFAPIAMNHENSTKSRQLNFVDENDYNGKCRQCILKKVCSNCLGINYKERGDCYEPSGFDCAQFKLFFIANCKLQLLMAIKNKDELMYKTISNVINFLIKQKSCQN